MIVVSCCTLLVNYDFRFVLRHSDIEDYVLSKLKNAQDKCDSHRNCHFPRPAFPVSFVLILQTITEFLIQTLLKLVLTLKTLLNEGTIKMKCDISG
jgi:hypothetical protein